MTYAKVIADSTYEGGTRLTTLEVQFHRFVLAEFNTHRVFSRNSASSRAIPVAKQIERVRKDPAIPVVFPAEQKGMQGGEPLSSMDAQKARGEWLTSSLVAASIAEKMAYLGVHKSVVNRVLEPYIMHTIVVTSTAWDNFFKQRCSPLAQPEIRVAAEMMRDAMDASEPRFLVPGDWHLPYVGVEDLDAVAFDSPAVKHDLRKISAARCARVSYLTQDGRRNLSEDYLLYDRLVTADPMHASPLEHVARPKPTNQHTVAIHPTDLDQTKEGRTFSLTLPKYGNLLGWHQLRFDVEYENSYQAYS